MVRDTENTHVTTVRRRRENAAQERAHDAPLKVGTAFPRIACSSLSLASLCLLLLSVEVLGKGLRDKEREDDGCVGADLDGPRAYSDLPPRDGLVEPRTAVAAIELLPRADEHALVGPVAHQVGVHDMVLDHPPADDDGPRVLCLHRLHVDPPDVAHEVEHEPRFLVRVKEEHVPNGPVCERRAVDGDVVLGAPVVDALLVVDLEAHPPDHARRRPRLPAHDRLVRHLVEQRHEPLLELAVVLVGHEHVPDAVQPLQPQRLAVELEPVDHARVESGVPPQVRGREALDEILLDAPRRGDDAVHHLVLAQEADRLAHPARRHVARVAQEDGRPRVLPHLGVPELVRLVLLDGLIAEPPLAHLLDLVDGEAEVGGLEAAGGHAGEQRVVVDAVTLVEVVPLDLDAPRGHLHRLDQHILRRGARHPGARGRRRGQAGGWGARGAVQEDAEGGHTEEAGRAGPGCGWAPDRPRDGVQGRPALRPRPYQA
mmetsp:Transcript_29539/g.72876  ORF Transcript_29539/g.72876 Transcript_29539/m.72876 type:complete len:485 (+) Transcript_29539:130-1584(+)